MKAETQTMQSKLLTGRLNIRSAVQYILTEWFNTPSMVCLPFHFDGFYVIGERENPYDFSLGMKASPRKVLQLLNNMTSERMLVSELGKVEEHLGIAMDLYHMPCKSKSGLGFRHTIAE